ncbi:hypothetical protein VT84_37070 [Gemmata sp. SH-PL17]|uniref:hypothetical protein n=1 Tax=Gemmata sp. SH-PL17 TaxID=1630693 RepID=UPI00078DF51A|nr:hypothetical protein [Gemmata sp. SH-PL17]AMV30065.1 hypothetical protein VT84_37070 [Gemmata sp. SH-PL17]
MTLPKQVYREHARRTNRTLATYLSLLGCVSNLDCVAVTGAGIKQFWNVLKVHEDRIKWLKEDVKSYFPHVRFLRDAKRAGAIDGVCFSRRLIGNDIFPPGTNLGTALEALTGSGFQAATIPLPTEAEMLSRLTLAIHGLAASPAKAKA